MPKKIETDSENFLITNIKSLLQEKIWLLENRLQKKRMGSTYKSLTNSEARILAVLRGEELTIAEISRRLCVSRQAVHKIVSGLVDRKLLKLEFISGNARDKRIVFTQAGEKMKQEAMQKLYELEKEIEAAIGSRNLTLLKLLLKKEW